MKTWGTVLLGIALAPAASADFDAASYPPYETCALCHGLFGQSRLDKFPHLAGQKPVYIQNQLEAFLAGTRDNDGGQMSSIVTELEPKDFAVVVAWFSGQDPPAPAASPSDDVGARLVQSGGCLSCHEDASQDNVPHLTAQHAGYLVKQMQDFRTGRRTRSDTAVLHQGLLEDVSENIDDIAAYLASLERLK